MQAFWVSWVESRASVMAWITRPRGNPRLPISSLKKSKGEYLPSRKLLALTSDTSIMQVKVMVDFGL